MAAALPILCIVLTLAFLYAALPGGIVYLVPRAHYPGSQQISSKAGMEPDATGANLLIYSHTVLRTSDPIEQVHGWYTGRGWRDAGSDHGIVLGADRKVDLLGIYGVFVYGSVGIVPQGGTEIEIWTRVFVIQGK